MMISASAAGRERAAAVAAAAAAVRAHPSDRHLWTAPIDLAACLGTSLVYTHTIM